MDDHIYSDILNFIGQPFYNYILNHYTICKIHSSSQKHAIRNLK